MDVEQFRRLALALPDTVEGAHHGHPDFRAHGRVIASLHADGERAMVRVPIARQRELCAAHGDVFAPAAGAWGRDGCTMLRLAAAPVDVVRDALTDAWQLAASDPRPVRRSRAPAAKPAARRARDAAAAPVGPRLDLGLLALALPGTTQGIACAGTTLESRTFAVGKKAFLFVSPTVARLKLAASLGEAKTQGLEVGASGWVKLPLDELPALATVQRWLAESHALAGGAAASAPTGGRRTRSAAARQPEAKRQSKAKGAPRAKGQPKPKPKPKRAPQPGRRPGPKRSPRPRKPAPPPPAR